MTGSDRTRAARPRPGALALGALLLLMLAPLGACTTLGLGGAGSVELRSFETSASVAPRWTTAVYSTDDPNTANIYLSDLPLDALVGREPHTLDDARGNILHIRMFIRPRAGRTPIDYNASNVAIRHIVIAPGTMGVYGGGGFLLPSGRPGNRNFGGSIRGATLRLTDAAPAFADRLGATELSGRVNATLDNDRAEAIATTITGLLARREVAPVATRAE